MGAGPDQLDFVGLGVTDIDDQPVGFQVGVPGILKRSSQGVVTIGRGQSGSPLISNSTQRRSFLRSLPRLRITSTSFRKRFPEEILITDRGL